MTRTKLLKLILKRATEEELLKGLVPLCTPEQMRWEWHRRGRAEGRMYGLLRGENKAPEGLENARRRRPLPQ